MSAKEICDLSLYQFIVYQRELMKILEMEAQRNIPMGSVDEQQNFSQEQGTRMSAADIRKQLEEIKAFRKWQKEQ